MVLTFVLTLAHDEEREQFRCIAVQLFGQLAHLLGPELCQSYIVAEVVSLSDDEVFRVRKTIAAHLPSICKVVGPEMTTARLLKVFVRLSRDDIWGVRKSVVESIVKMSESLPPDQRQPHLGASFDFFLADNSRWVRNAAYIVLGQYISTLPSEHISEKLLDQFKASADGDGASSDPDIAYACAFNFPAVLQSIGRARWAALAPSYRSLSQDARWKVRRSLAASVHVVSELLGVDLAEQHTLPVLDAFLKDIDQVRFLAVQNLAGVLSLISPAARARYLDALMALQGETETWRFRKALAEQLGKLAPLFEPRVIVDRLIPLTIAVCRDQFARVRIAAAKALASVTATLVKSSASDPSILSAATSPMAELAKDLDYHVRLVFVYAAAEIALNVPVDVFESKFLPIVMDLAKDSIPNIRLTVAREFSRISLAGGYSSNNGVQNLLALLASDRDIDVVFFSNPHWETLDLPRYNGRKPQPSSVTALSQSVTGLTLESSGNSAAALLAAKKIHIAPVPADIVSPGTPRNDTILLPNVPFSAYSTVPEDHGDEDDSEEDEPKA